MKILVVLLALFVNLNAQVIYDDYFLDRTLRLDYYHTGDAGSEIISFDELIEEPYWGGSKVNLIDNINFGNYMVKVFDEETGRLIYSRGYSTLYQEWQTTSEAKNTQRTFHGTVVFPYPKKNVVVEIYRRNKKNIFVKKFSYHVDPSEYFISKERKFVFDNFKVRYAGNPAKKLDIVFIPDGYSADQMNQFEKDCEVFANYLFMYSPFSENKDKINIWGIRAVSHDSGTDIPGDTVWKNTVLSSSFYTFDSERYLMTYDYKTVRSIASNAPYDQIYILVNTDKYGGGSIYNFYSTTAARNTKTRQIFVHEFGHGLAGLADEYGDDTTYNEFYPVDVEPWEANITTLVNFESKWKDLVGSDIPIPTPEEDKYKNVTGVFEGAGYVAKGVYRPTYNSIMRAFNSDEFNLVSKMAIQKIIDFYSE